MHKARAINGSPRMEKGNTALVLNTFLQSMRESVCEVDLHYANRLKVLRCTCGKMYCWRDKPGECCFKDDMQLRYPKLKAADILILATPVYIPLPGAMQNVLNRFCPLLAPELQTRESRTRVKFRNDVNILKIVLVATGGWWELENLDRVVLIVKEFAEAAGVEFAGAVLRPHANLLRCVGKVTPGAESVLNAVKLTDKELIEEGAMTPETLRLVSHPLITLEEFMQQALCMDENDNTD